MPYQRQLAALILVFSCTMFMVPCAAQEEADSTEAPLPELVIRAFQSDRRLREVPAPVSALSRSALQRYAPVSVVAAVNTLPGVRMEERSPGSYRFNIRGSALRSPFGVRNIKVYFNGLPLTDPGGQTYLNQLGFLNYGHLEVVRGPASSLYGAGTGGALLIEEGQAGEGQGLQAGSTFGSFGLRQANASVQMGPAQQRNQLTLQHLQSEGYRDHSALRRDVVSWTGRYRLDEKRQLTTTFLYGDLFYQTPGALTLAEFKADPAGARPAAGGFPSAEAAGAGIRQRSVLAGTALRQQWNRRWSNETLLYGMFTDLRNPTIRNYEKNALPHFGGRSQFTYQYQGNAIGLQWQTGAEWQQGLASVSVYRNRNGRPDSLISGDEISSRQAFVFTQIRADWKAWQLTAGASINSFKLGFERFQPVSAGRQVRTIRNQWAPRIAFSRKFAGEGLNVLLYSSLSKGFSPPSTAELLPTGGAINAGLQPEQGLNLDFGIKATIEKRLYIDVNLFRFTLDNTIVQRRDAGGGDFFINAGKTRQVGIETYLGLPLARGAARNASLLWISHTWSRFRYRSFRQLTNDFSGKQLPGIPAHLLSAGFDLSGESPFYASLTYQYSDRIPLNDANSAYSDAYHLLSIKTGYRHTLGRMGIRYSIGVDNLLNQVYSLGNDFNGFGGRYFNAAPSRNYYVSVDLEWRKRASPSLK